jgi:transcriptional regulator NrdR family protein
MKHIVKRNGKTESFDNRKLYASIYTSCLSVHEQPLAAELVAQKVTKDIETWLFNKNEVSANDIRRVAGKYLSKINPSASYLYLHHRIIW